MENKNTTVKASVFNGFKEPLVVLRNHESI